MERVTSIALNDDFIRGLTDILQEDFIQKNIPLEKVAVVFGGKRPALFLKRELSRRINGAYFPPAFFSMDEFVKEVVWRKSPARMISSMDLAFCIYELAKAAHPGLLIGRDSFAMFLPWAEEISAFIEQLDLEEIEDDKLRSVQENAKIGFDTLKEVNLLLADIIKLRKEFHGAFKKAGALTRGMLYMSAAECAKDVNFDDFEAIIFCGFFYLHKTEQKLINELLSRGKARLVFQGDENEWDVLKGLSAVFSKPIKADAPARKKKPEINFYRGFDMHSQVGILREKLKEIKNLEKTLILLANPDALVPLLSEISSLGVDFNVSIGYPLKRSSVYSLFQDIFAAQLSRKGSSYYSRDYLKALSHPFLKNLEIVSVSRVVAHKAEEALTGTIESELAGELFINLDEIAGLPVLLEEAQDTLKHMDIKVSLDDIAKTFKELNELAFGIWEDIGSFYEFTVAAEKVIMVLLEKSPLEKYAPNLKAAEKILELVEELRNASFCQEKFSQEEMFGIFTQRLEREMISFFGSPLKGMQVLGLLETRSLTFKNVMVMDVNESILPKLRIYEPLIPRDVMVSLGIERLEKEEEIQRYQFTRLISAAENVHLIYREDRETIRSRFLEDIIWKEEQKQGKVGVVEIPLYSFNIKALPKKAIVKKTKDMIEFLKKRVFSASSVNMYVSCPLKFYFCYCLGLEEKEDLFDEPEAVDVGIFVHELLEKTYAGFMNKKPVIDERFEKLFFAEFDKLFKQKFSRKMKADSFILEDILRYRMKKFLESEKQRNDIDAVVMLEKRIPWKIETQSGVFDFIAGVDRVDKRPGGSFLVIDYKTGGAQTPNVNLDNLEFCRGEIKNVIKSFQLPIYIWACRENLKAQDVSAAIYFLRTCEIKEYLWKATPKNKKENLDACLKAISFILDEIINPDVAFVADKDAQRNCAYCPYSSLCR
ncbi:MAG: PD-(D/E)XK nuclease family protein [Candidatus Omnitrophica bacterium]|nr:PD-(D/E)XK nuclease family protein [Candidatus Omnitrophota bacterium]